MDTFGTLYRYLFGTHSGIGRENSLEISARIELIIIRYGIKRAMDDVKWNGLIRLFELS
jgi:hypothetical protein